MPNAYVMFSVKLGSEEEVLKEVRSISEIQEAYISHGVYDLVVKVITESTEQLKELVTHRLRMMADVKSTLTLILVEEQK